MKISLLIVLTFLSCVVLPMAHAAPDAAPPNFSFEQGQEHWLPRYDTPTAYNVAGGVAELLVAKDDSVQNRGAVYLYRQDLPIAEGYYRLRFESKSGLSEGNAGARISALDKADQELEHFLPGASGVPILGGNSDWTPHEFVYHIPAHTARTRIQLQLMSGVGSVSFRRLSLQQLSDSEGKSAMEMRQQFTIPPFKTVPVRTPQHPLKNMRMIFTDAEIALARSNIAQYPAAKKVQENILKAADQWLQWDDDDLRKLLSSAQVPRAFDVNANGCPIHGDEVFKKGGTYPWILDPHHPFKVTCPVGGETYPSNDYESYANSNFTEKKGGDTKYVDDGWGWVAPNGERYWFVAYANHWNWYRTIEPALLNLSRAYILTGERKYAHKAAVMLTRLAEVYPAMDYEWQSRYGAMMRAQGEHYPGKVLGAIPETFMSRDFAEAYDNIWDSIDGDGVLQGECGKTGPQIRSFIEANLLEDAIDAYFTDQISGNYGMHQNALLHLLLARQNVDLPKYFHLLVDEPGEDGPHMGLRYALYNLVWRDGLPLESPGYNDSWIENFATLSSLLARGGFSLFDDPKLKMLFDGTPKLTAIGRFTPDIGDTGSIFGQLLGRDAGVYQTAYNAYHDPIYLTWLSEMNRTGPDGFGTFESLFLPMLPPTKPLSNKRATSPQPSRLLAGYGVGILNNRADTSALTLTYGKHISHYHWDFLNFDLFANGQKMMPDLGYPDAMNIYVPGIYSWSTNTIAHNTVVVDQQRQDQNLPGVVHDFSDGNFARSVDASSPAYAQASEYRRNLIMVDADDDQSYTVDFFRVTGGSQHDYSLHGPPGEVSTMEGTWSEKRPGTLAGVAVGVGDFYDDAKLGAAGYSGGYDHYHGSGFQHLFNAQQLEQGKSTVQYQHAKDADACLRIHLLPQPDQQVFLADAFDLPRAKNNTLKYMIARRQSTGGGPLKSTFVSVLETYRKQPYIQSVESAMPTRGNGAAVIVKRENATDLVISDTSHSIKTFPAFDIETDADSAVVTFNADGDPTRVYFSDGTYLNCKGEKYTSASQHGEVTAVDAKAATVTVQLENAPKKAAHFTNRIAYFSNAWHDSAHPLASATLRGNQLILKTQDALLVGRLKLTGVKRGVLSTDTALPLSETYNGTTLLDEKFHPLALVKKVEQGEIALAAQPEKMPAANSDAWLSDIGVGDKMLLKSVFSWKGAE